VTRHARTALSAATRCLDGPSGYMQSAYLIATSATKAAEED